MRTEQNNGQSLTDELVKLGAKESATGAKVCQWVGLTLIVIGALIGALTLNPPSDQPAAETGYIRIGSIGLAIFGVLLFYLSARAKRHLNGALDKR